MVLETAFRRSMWAFQVSFNLDGTFKGEGLMSRSNPSFESAAAAEGSGRRGALALGALLVVVLSFSARVDATIIAPNPGGTTVVTNSTTSSYVFQDTAVTQRVDNYATTLSAFLNGNPVYSASFSAPYSDPSVQAAVTAADAILTGDSASFGVPQLTANTTVLQSSVTAAPVVTCAPCTAATGNTTVTTTDTFGPNTIMVGDNQSELFTILSGQLDINVNTNNEYWITRNIVTSDTYLTSQSYSILGATTAGASVPEPPSVWLLMLGLCALAAWRWRRGRVFGP